MTKNKETQINSIKIEFKDAHGRHLKGYLDQRNDGKKNKLFVIISPGYAETKRDYISTSYYLAANGFIVLRYDCTNHLGESDGDIINFKLSDMKSSMTAAMDYLEAEYKVTGVGIVASSLSGPVSFKIAAKDKKINYIIALTSIVNLRDTLIALYKEDLIGEYKNKKRWGVIDILGFEVKDDFLKEAIADNYEDLDASLADIKKIDIPICYLVAENDAWIKYEDMKTLYKNSKNKNSRFVTIPGALHQIQENPRLAKKAILEIVSAYAEYARAENESGSKLQEPSIHDIVVQNKIEVSNLKSIFSVTKADEKHFWVDYLSKYFVLIKSMDYQNLLSLIAQSFGDLRENNSILDAGCGNGHFGAWLLCNLANRPFAYTGLDFAENALKDAERIHAGIFKTSKIDKNGHDFKYILADLEEEIPLGNDMFDKICCNLVISYLKNPHKVLKDLYMKLKPGGKIVVSSLKPYNDLSLIYKDYLDQNLTEEDILEGRMLLSSAGKIRHKEKQGHYHFFSEEELERTMEQAGFKGIKVYRAFGNQANVAVGEK